MSNPRGSLRTHNNRAGIILWLLILPLILVPTGGQTRAPAHGSGVSAQSARIVEGYGKLPRAFEANRGQTAPQVKFLSRGAGYSLFLTSNEAVLTLGKAARQEAGPLTAKAALLKSQHAKQEKPSVLRMKLLGASAKAEVTGQDQLPGKSNYFIGNDPKKWHTDVPQYAKVRYANVYPGVDLVYYGNQRELEYDFVVQPGADPNLIRLRIEGAQNLRLKHGNLVLTSAAGEVHLCRPLIYQETNGRRHEISGTYVMKSKNEAGFRISDYDPTRALIIDPVLAYSTYLGGSNFTNGWSIAVDISGHAYVTGATQSPDFPMANAIQSTKRGCPSCYDAFVSKFNPDGTALIYSTYLGGSIDDEARGIAVDSVGNAYVTGTTTSADFPTVNAIQPTNHGGGCNKGSNCDAFVTKINAAGSTLVYSTYLGGSGGDSAFGIAVDETGNAYMTGVTYSTDFPTANPIQPAFHGTEDVFVTKINAVGSAFVYSTYLGGSSYDEGLGIAADSVGNAYVTGRTVSTDFPIANAFQPTSRGSWDAFVTKITADGSAFVYSTYLGGTYDDGGAGIAVDSAGNVYVAGTTSSPDFPTINAIQTTNRFGDAFVTKMNAQGNALVYSTFLGGGAGDYGSGIAADSAGNAYVMGQTGSTDFPAINAIQTKNGGHNDAFVTKINSDGSAFMYSTYLGGTYNDYATGIAVDPAGTVYVTGSTQSGRFPHTIFALQQSPKGSGEAFAAKIASQTFLSVSPARVGFGTVVIGTASVAKYITLTNHGSGSLAVNSPFIAGFNAVDFAEVNNCPATLSPGSLCTVSITVTPSAKGQRQATLGLSDSDPTSPQAVPLSGFGTAVSLSPKMLAFGKVTVGNTSSPKAVILTNVGSTQLNFTGFSITGQNASDYFQTNTCGTSIAAGGNCKVTVTFKPTAVGTRKAAVSISDDGGGSPQQIALTGTGS